MDLVAYKRKEKYGRSMRDAGSERRKWRPRKRSGRRAVDESLHCFYLPKVSLS